MADSAVVEPWAPGSADPKVAFAEFQLHLREITPRVRVLPTIFALNVLVFAAMVASGVSAINPTVAGALTWGANYGPRTLNGEPWRLVTNFFVHFGIVHLAANMFALWNAGAVVERLFGPLAFAAIYFAAGITASVASLAVHPTVVSAGASGAIFGVYGALAAFVLLRRGAIPKVVLSRLSGVAGTFIFYNIFYGAAHTGIDNAAHLGGLIGGFVAGAFLIQPLVIDRPSEPRRPALTVAAAVVLAGAVVLVMPRPLDFNVIVTDFAVSESAVSALYDAATASFDSRHADAAQTGEQIQRNVLPPWQAARAKLQSQTNTWLHQSKGTSAQKQMLELLLQEGEVRETGLTRLAAALRIGDPPAAAAAVHDMKEAAQRISTEVQNLKP
jgi:rhomboid protease GluP